MLKRRVLATIITAAMILSLIPLMPTLAADMNDIMTALGTPYVDFNFSDDSGLKLEGNSRISSDERLVLTGDQGTYATADVADLDKKGGSITISFNVYAQARLAANEQKMFFTIGAPAVDTSHEETAIYIYGTRNNIIGGIVNGGSTVAPSRIEVSSSTYLNNRTTVNIALTYDTATKTLAVFANGTLGARVTNMGGIDLEDILTAAAGKINIGNSFKSNTSAFYGRLDNLKVWNRVLSDADIQRLSVITNLQNNLQYLTLDTEKDVLYNEQKIHNPVTHDVLLWQWGKLNGTATGTSYTIDWTSSNPDILNIKYGANGRPIFAEFNESEVDESIDRKVTLTATMSAPGPENETITASKQLVLDIPSWTKRRQMDLDAITITTPDDIRESLPLSAKGKYGSDIDWVSSDPSIVSDKAITGIDDPFPGGGVVVRPGVGEKPSHVTLTATVTMDGVSGALTRDFDLTITPISPDMDAPREKFLWTYYSERQDWRRTGETREEMYFAIGVDGENWEYLNMKTRDDNTIYTEPILSSTVGDQGLRDAHFVRSGYGDKFYAMATDLHAVGTSLTTPGALEGWHASGITTWDDLNASRNLAVWDSNDLTEWGTARLVKVNRDFGGNTYAPESIYDEERQAHLVYFCSRDAAEMDVNGNLNNGSGGRKEMYYCYTRDFVTFTEPKIFFTCDDIARLLNVSRPSQILDTHIVYDDSDGYFYRFTAGPGYCFVDRSDNLDPALSNWKDLTRVAHFAKPGGGSSYEAPTTIKLPDGNWLLYLDNFTEYVPFRATGTGKLVDFMTGDFVLATENGSITLNPPYPGTTGRMMPAVKHGMVLPISDREYGALLAKFGTIDKAPVEWTVESITVEPAESTVNLGSTKTFTATVLGDNSPPQTVVWSVEGMGSTGTQIDPDTGVLTVAADETSETLIVRATHTHEYFNTISGATTVSVRPEVLELRAKTIEGTVTITAYNHTQQTVENVIFIAALYNTNGQLAKIEQVQTNIDAGESTSLSLTLYAGQYYKAFLWDSDYKPLIKAID